MLEVMVLMELEMVIMKLLIVLETNMDTLMVMVENKLLEEVGKTNTNTTISLRLFLMGEDLVKETVEDTVLILLLREEEELEIELLLITTIKVGKMNMLILEEEAKIINSENHSTTMMMVKLSLREDLEVMVIPGLEPIVREVVREIEELMEFMERVDKEEEIILGLMSMLLVIIEEESIILENNGEEMTRVKDMFLVLPKVTLGWTIQLIDKMEIKEKHMVLMEPNKKPNGKQKKIISL